MGWVTQRALDEKLGGRGAAKVMRRSARMLSAHKRPAILAIVAMLGSTLATLAGPAIIRYAIDNGLRHRHRDALDKAAIGYGLTMVGAFAFGRAQIRLVGRVGEGFLRDLRVRAFGHLEALPMSFYDGETTGRLVARLTSDVDALSELVQLGLVTFVTNGLLIVLSLCVLFAMSPWLALVAMIGVPVVAVASVKFRRDSDKAYLVLRDRIASTLSSLQEGLSGVRVIQAFAREDAETERFVARNREQYHANIAATKISAWYFPVVEFSGSAATAVVIGVGGILVHQGRATVGTVAAFVLYLGNLFEPIQQLSQLFNTLQSAGAALNKLFGLLDVPNNLADKPGAVGAPASGPIEVHDVSFRYESGEVDVLQHVSLHIAEGERIALVGPTGAGKSTLAKLVARLYDPTDGSITFAGTDLRDIQQRSLRHRILVVPQEGYLFAGSILDNVRVGNLDATDAEVEKALLRIGAWDRFVRLPEGLRTEVNERGARLSAGERQLVSLARAALADPAVLVLDEATSNLDPGTQAEVEEALEALMHGRTVVVIAHRLSTAERADRIGVVADGGLVELGSHDELVAQGGRYAALYASWTAGLASGAGPA